MKALRVILTIAGVVGLFFAFRYLVGLPHGVTVTGYLNNFFGRDYSS